MYIYIVRVLTKEAFHAERTEEERGQIAPDNLAIHEISHTYPKRFRARCGPINGGHR